MLLVFGPRSTDYDFGPGSSADAAAVRAGHRPAAGGRGGARVWRPSRRRTTSCCWCHAARYLEVVRRFSDDPFGFPEAGIGEGGDCPPFAGMHEASAAVAGGSMRAVEAILRGDVEHAQHPGGGLHHAMPDRASGFCIYNDPALAIARARRDGLRVLYIDLDVHHGDGVQAHPLGRPGRADVLDPRDGPGAVPGHGRRRTRSGRARPPARAVNVPLPPGTGEGAWLDAPSTSLLPELAATFGPDLIVSQHGADSHAWDPLAHLNVTTTAHGAAARLVDTIAHRYAGRSVAGDRRRRVRRVPGRAADLGADLAGRRASRGAGGDAGGLARSMGGRGGTLRAGAAPRAVRRRAERGARDGRDAGGRRGPRAGGRGARPARAGARGSCGRGGDRGWWDPLGAVGRPADGGRPARGDGHADDPRRRRCGDLGRSGARAAGRRPGRSRGGPCAGRWPASRDGARVTAAVVGHGRRRAGDLARPMARARADLLALGVAPGSAGRAWPASGAPRRARVRPGDVERRRGDRRRARRRRAAGRAMRAAIARRLLDAAPGSRSSRRAGDPRGRSAGHRRRRREPA